MSITYTITVTDAQQKALEYIFYNPQEWIENTIKERADLAMQDIVSFQLQLTGNNIDQSVEEIVLNANIRSAAERRNHVEGQANSIANT